MKNNIRLRMKECPSFDTKEVGRSVISKSKYFHLFINLELKSLSFLKDLNCKKQLTCILDSSNGKSGLQ